MQGHKNNLYADTRHTLDDAHAERDVLAALWGTSGEIKEEKTSLCSRTTLRSFSPPAGVGVRFGGFLCTHRSLIAEQLGPRKTPLAMGGHQDLDTCEPREKISVNTRLTMCWVAEPVPLVRRVMVGRAVLNTDAAAA